MSMLTLLLASGFLGFVGGWRWQTKRYVRQEIRWEEKYASV